MSKIPPKIRAILAQDPYMMTCCHCGSVNKIEWHHCFIYSRRQINEVWAIIGLCHDCHNKPEIKGDFAKYISLIRVKAIYGIDITLIRIKYPKFNWETFFDFLNDKYMVKYNKQANSAIDSGMNLAEQFPQIREW
jgi:hypothetical protein